MNIILTAPILNRMVDNKRLLIIGTAQQNHIRDRLEMIERGSTDVLLLIPERDRNRFPDERAIYFSGSFHPFFPPLLKAMLSFRPDECVIVCGLAYDHDNVLRAVAFLASLLRPDIKICVRNQDSPADTGHLPNPVKVIFNQLALAPLALLIRAASIFRKIRIGEIYSLRIGHQALECEIYLSEKELGRHEGSLDLFCFKDGAVANRTLAALFSRKMPISKWNNHLLQAVRGFGMEQDHELPLNTRLISLSRDYECLLQQTGPHVNFTAAETERGLREMQSCGIDPKTRLICILGRDPAFLQNAMPHHNDSDMQEPRNMDISTFRSGAEYLLEQGCSVVRMGSVVREPLDIAHPRFLDYATSDRRSDFMDIFLTSRCSFFVGVQSGLLQTANIFRIPCLRVNVARIEVIEYCSPEDLALFKLIWSKSEKRILKIPEILAAGISRWPIENFANSDFEVIDNTEDELREAIIEMHLRVNGKWQSTSEEQELQERYRSYFRTSDYNSRFETPISAYFLRKHQKKIL